MGWQGGGKLGGGVEGEQGSTKAPTARVCVFTASSAKGGRDVCRSCDVSTKYCRLPRTREFYHMCQTSMRTQAACFRQFEFIQEGQVLLQILAALDLLKQQTCVWN